MPELTTEAALNIMTGWLQDNIDCGTGLCMKNELTWRFLGVLRNIKFNKMFLNTYG
ncbi:hypothetical protein [Enterobacter ludwigii]|uniref:hypothetical protein n=1 Tax=Enterobacter ludwigii TaxID=299767 RepID=UPI001867D8B5|nr:hypothetical protein [Enterobacter ludwigii]